mmetsp:Transcript_54002/g.109868  ORF Transcript_54002/g.109868 Transcript_54002/m.109868 type:complete len:367 (+) Transcript_54002:22-1122(+)
MQVFVWHSWQPPTTASAQYMNPQAPNTHKRSRRTSCSIPPPLILDTRTTSSHDALITRRAQLASLQQSMGAPNSSLELEVEAELVVVSAEVHGVHLGGGGEGDRLVEGLGVRARHLALAVEHAVHGGVGGQGVGAAHGDGHGVAGGLLVARLHGVVGLGGDLGVAVDLLVVRTGEGAELLRRGDADAEVAAVVAEADVVLVPVEAGASADAGVELHLTADQEALVVDERVRGHHGAVDHVHGGVEGAEVGVLVRQAELRGAGVGGHEAVLGGEGHVEAVGDALEVHLAGHLGVGVDLDVLELKVVVVEGSLHGRAELVLAQHTLGLQSHSIVGLGLDGDLVLVLEGLGQQVLGALEEISVLRHDCR